MDYHRLISDGKDREKKWNGKEKGEENEGARENLTVRRARLYREMPIFAHEEKLFCMKTIANILAFVSTYTVIAMVFLIIAQSFIKCIHNANTLTAMQERITVIVCLLAAAALIPFFHYPY